MKRIFFLTAFAGFIFFTTQALAVNVIKGTVSYFGPETGTIHIGAFNVPCSQIAGLEPKAGTDIAGPGPYSMEQPGVGGVYYICAFMDAKGDGPPPDAGDPEGEYSGNPVTLAGEVDVPGVDIILRDPYDPIPTVSKWGFLGLLILLVASSLWMMRRKSQNP
ncbi:MAG: hypothetical protein JRK53_20270 [Deltaproteobacteria bacterium]|nr:hypothetical protein [Deltaproteobacteria bacterium]MBW1815846.1 hypothetical protein [Deltaproteobacteria bacterium]MBW2283246.1 hypothetical protein [Deltaproteobacteria bacterium]